MATITKLDDKIQLYCDYTDVEKCRALPCGKWNKAVGCWEYPLSVLPFAMDAFKQASIDDALLPHIKRMSLLEQNVTSLISGKTVPRKHKFLMEHQRKCRDIAAWLPKFGLFCDTGTGKTLLAYAIMQDRLASRWVVVAPKNLIRTAWMADHADFFSDLKVLPLSQNFGKDDYIEIAKRWGLQVHGRMRAADWQPYLMEYADILIINPESFKLRKDIQDWPHGGMIVDESSMLRDMKSQITQDVISHADKMEFCYLLSGKPAPNNELEYFPQMRIINRALFGESYYKFRDRYFQTVDYFQHDWRMKPEMRDRFSELLAKGCIFISKADCLDLPPDMPPIIRTVELSPKARKIYRDMEHDRIAILEDRTIPAKTKLVELGKLRQLASGFIIDTDDDSKAVVVHKDKLNELAQVIRELGDNKAVIWISYKPEVHEISALMESMGKTYVTAYSGTKKIDDSVAAFQNDTAQFIIAHPKSLKYGQTFTGRRMKTNCTYAIYYSMSHSYEDYYQSHDRIYRKGQTEKCTFIILTTENSIDEDIWQVVQGKGNAASLMESMIKRTRLAGR